MGRNLPAEPRPRRRAWLLRTGSCLVCATVGFRCTLPPASRTVRESDALISFLRRDRRPPFEAAATVSIIAEGARYRGSAQVFFRNDSSFEITLYDPFGGRLLGVDAAAGGAVLASPAGKFRLKDTGNVVIPDMGISYPFSFRVLTRSITGRLPRVASLPDNGRVRRGPLKAVLVWELDSATVQAAVGRRNGRPKAVSYVSKGTYGGWLLRFSAFEGDMPRRIEYRNDHESLDFRYERIIFSP